MSDNKDYWREIFDVPDDGNGKPDIGREPENRNNPGTDLPYGDMDYTNTEKNYSGDDMDYTRKFENLDRYAPERRRNMQYSEAGNGAEDDFEVDFDFDGEYRDVPDDRPIKRRREKKAGCLGGIFYATFIICISLVLASLGWLAATDVLGFGDADKLVEITIPDNFNMDDVSKTLKDNGLIKYEFLFKIFANFSHAEDKISGGTYQLNTNFDYRAIVNGMTESGGMLVETDNITIPEGYTLAQIFELLEANKVCSQDELWETATNYDFKYDFLDSTTLGNKLRLEGFMFPDTYKFYVNDSPEDVINKFLENFDSKFTAEYRQRATEMGYKIQDIISVASMIEREAGHDDERGLVASVIYNRLNSEYHRALQLDSTINYIISMTGEAFSTDIDSPYNTYANDGLPAGPIANPGMPSIKAALYPEDTYYYYFGLDVNGDTRFFEDYDEFEAFVASEEYGG